MGKWELVLDAVDGVLDDCSTLEGAFSSCVLIGRVGFPGCCDTGRLLCVGSPCSAARAGKALEWRGAPFERMAVSSLSGIALSWYTVVMPDAYSVTSTFPTPPLAACF